MNADYRMNSRLSLTGYLGWAEGLAAIQAIYPNGNNSRFCLFGSTDFFLDLVAGNGSRGPGHASGGPPFYRPNRLNSLCTSGKRSV